MQILTNTEFVNLVSNQANRLQTIAKKKQEEKPDGFLTTKEASQYTEMFQRFGDHKSATWLQNLITLCKSGKLKRMRTNTDTYQDHVDHVHVLHANGEIPFDIGDHIQSKDTGKRGTVVDYKPDSKEFLVVFDPFQIQQVTTKEISKIAEEKEAVLQLQPVGSNMTLLTLDTLEILFSYSTPVAYVDKTTGMYYKTDERFSATTSRHINQWLAGTDAEVVPQAQIEALVQDIT